jgi:hypothetical protein
MGSEHPYIEAERIKDKRRKDRVGKIKAEE